MIAETQSAPKQKSKARQKIKEGVVHIQSTYNNTIISVTDQSGNVVASSSAGRVGFSGTRKGTPYAAQQAVADITKQIQMIGMEKARVFVKGIGSARDSAIRALSSSGLSIYSIRDLTPIPHNGVRPAKRRRV